MLTQGDRRLRGVDRVSRPFGRAGAAAGATLDALGELAGGMTVASVERLTAGPVQVLRVALHGGGGEWEGSCSMTGRTEVEAAARAVLDALNPMWGT